MELKSFIEAIKSFFYDFLGYLLPGTISITLVVYVFDLEFSSINPFLNNSIATISFWMFSYVFGYVLYGMTEFLNKKLFKHHDNFDDNYKTSRPYKDALSKLLQNKCVTSDSPEDYNVRLVRSICMSKTPENDEKIYLFTFRYVLANQLTSIFISIGLIGIIISIVQFFCNSVQILKGDLAHFIFYFLLLFFSYFTYKTDMRFYEISMKLPFINYIATNRKTNEN